MYDKTVQMDSQNWVLVGYNYDDQGPIVQS